MILITLTVLTAVWFLASFLLGISVTFGFWPQRIPLPWSDAGDFVQATNGRVYIDLGFYSRILCYDRDGKFIASYSYSANAKGTKLAAGKSGLIYVCANNAVYTFNSTWKRVDLETADPAKPRVWKLSRDSRPLFVDGETGRVPNRAIRAGEFLFAPSQPEIRMSFECEDGTVLERNADSIDRVSKSGRTICKYSPPRGIAWLLTVPWPALLAVPIFLAAVGCVALLGRIERYAPNRL